LQFSIIRHRKKKTAAKKTCAINKKNKTIHDAKFALKSLLIALPMGTLKLFVIHCDVLCQFSDVKCTKETKVVEIVDGNEFFSTKGL
jgi:hypothetical protein